ncbi:MAG: 50S ribosomal protein L18 [Bdellovibrionales bacterium]|nr:50S ribosomal protein L18 [Bdellovibrionales bacterium]
MAKKVRKRTDDKWAGRVRRVKRIRKKVLGTAERPRLCITKTNRSVVAQVINDEVGNTLLSVSTPQGKTSNITLATELGKTVAAKALAMGVKAVVFDRGGRVYHGRVAAVASGAREGGLKL